MVRSLPFLLIFELVRSSRAAAALSLVGTQDWQLSNANGSIQVNGNVTNSHMLLMAGGILKGDPYYRDNELRWKWVAQETWHYKTTFQSTDLLLTPGSSQILRCQIDTIATVRLNGAEIGKTKNMFVTYDFDISGHLAADGEINHIEVIIQPPLAYALNASLSYPYPVPESVYYHDWAEGPEHDDAGWGNGTYTHRNFVRKIASDFGWDWGPSFIPSGILRMDLISRRVATMEAVVIQQQHFHRDDLRSSTVTLTVQAHVAAFAATSGVVTVKAHLVDTNGTLRMVTAAAQRPLQLGAGESRWTELQIVLQEPLLWWPVGLGKQNLYEVEVHFGARGIRGLADGGGVAETVERRRVGLRTVELVKEPLAGGETFYFKINDREVFMRGSNMIPADIFQPRASEELEWILESALAANMNMVRVWGGGMYQIDRFYEMADKLGIMIWQEMMFGCALYPRDEAFLASVATEITQQAIRLQHHASIVVWGGNNENEVALTWYAISRQNRDRYVVDYIALYIETARKALLGVDGSQIFLDSSPSNGIISSSPYTKRWGKSGSGSYGDMHYYNYNADCEDASTYPKARFISEHGFQSFPSFTEYKPFLAEEDYNQNSTMLFYRQRHPQGQEQLLNMLQRHFRVPPAQAPAGTSQQKVFDDYLYLTQVQQSRCYETAFAQWRRDRSDKGTKNMGILYWQLNDIWQGPSWSSIEHSGAWRLTHSAVQRSFEPLTASLLLQNGMLRAFLTSDLQTPVVASLNLDLVRWKHGTTTRIKSWPRVMLHEAGTVECGEEPLQLERVLEHANCSASGCFAYLSGMSDNKPAQALSAYAFLTPLKDAELQCAKLDISDAVQLGPRSISFDVSVDAPAVYAAFETSLAKGRFEPNGALLLPTNKVKVTFTSRTDIRLTDFMLSLRGRSLRDTYGEPCTSLPHFFQTFV